METNMTRTRHMPILYACLAFLWLLVGDVTTPDAGADHAAWRGLGARIAGAYLLREQVEAETCPFFRLVTLSAAGNWLSAEANQQTREFSFTDQHGVWRQTGRREITATVLDFDLAPESHVATGVVRIRFVMRFSRELHQVWGEFFGETFTLEQNPLDPHEVPQATFGTTCTGIRVTVLPGMP
jgi:hypothetical protein